MKTLLVAIAALFFASQFSKADPYFDSIVRDPAHPKTSAVALYTSKFTFDAASMDVALVWHKGSAQNTILPQRLLDAGVKPLSWTLFEVGGGGDIHQNAFATAGWGINAAPTLLGPMAALLDRIGGPVATTASTLLLSDSGSGVKLSLCWKANVIENGDFVQFNHMRFPPRYGLGYQYQF